MAPSKKTQQEQTKKPDTTPDPEAIARHFMTLWQQQWQDYLRHAPTMPSDMQDFWSKTMGQPTSPFGFTGNFGQTAQHGKTNSTVDPAHMAATALAASQQCLELLKQFGERLDDVAKRVDTKPKPRTTKPSRKKRI